MRLVHDRRRLFTHPRSPVRGENTDTGRWFDRNIETGYQTEDAVYPKPRELGTYIMKVAV